MIDFYNGQITDILPFHIAEEPEVKAISYALQMGTQLLYKYAMRLYLWTDIDHQPEDVLDLMAAELRTQYYSQSLDIEAKRRLVKGTLAWYMTAGTPEAVEELITAVFGEGKVEEWFEYGGKPYCFKVITNAALTPETHGFFLTMIRRVKNTRSHMDALEFKRKTDLTIYAGAGIHTVHRPAAVTDGYHETRTAVQTFHAGTAVRMVHYQRITDGYTLQRTAAQKAHVGIAGRQLYRQTILAEGGS